MGFHLRLIIDLKLFLMIIFNFQVMHTGLLIYLIIIILMISDAGVISLGKTDMEIANVFLFNSF